MGGFSALRLGVAALWCSSIGLCAFGVWAEGAPGRVDAADGLPEVRAPGWYAALGDRAARRGDRAVALAAARAEARRDPNAYEAHQRLAYAAWIDAGGPTREALAALAEAYRLAPYPPADQMAWRVDLAEAGWAGLPDPLAAATLTQVDALGRIGTAWEPRVRWCRGARTEAIAEAACATVPGVEKGKDLRAVNAGSADAP